MSSNTSAWWKEIWSWDRVKDVIRGLPGRLGFEKNKELKFFRLRVNLDNGEVFDEILNRYLSDRERYGLYFILYKYSQADKEIEEVGEFISLSQLCPVIHCPMLKQNIKTFEKIFGFDKHLLYRAAKPFNYKEIDIGDVAVKIYILPRIPIIIGIWLGEEEISPSSIILYDKTITYYLDCESASILAGVVLARLIISLANSLSIDREIEYVYRYQCSE